jgi:uncharacterized RDD family membrane protein YckC
MPHHDEHENHSDDKEITIETLSTPPVHIPPAPLTKRVAAAALDSLIVALVWILLMAAGGESFSQFLTIDGALSLNLPSAGYLVIIVFAYYFLLEGTFASTLGKSLMKLRVLTEDGDPCSFGASFKRNVLRFVDWLPFLYVLAVVTMVVSHDRQRIGDKVAETIVTRAPEKDTNPPPAPFLFH